MLHLPGTKTLANFLNECAQSSPQFAFHGLFSLIRKQVWGRTAFGASTYINDAKSSGAGGSVVETG
jgi:hypothetical protein